MGQETELKLRLPRNQVEALRSHPLLAGVQSRGAVVRNDYYDTPALELASRGMALRLRNIGGQWLQTLKVGSEGGGGLHARQEWEFRVAGPDLDLAQFAGTPLADLGSQGPLRLRLEIVFSTDFKRRVWLLEPEPGSLLEVALDIGETRCGERVLPICELEIEVKRGMPHAAFDLAARLQESACLVPCPTNKAQHGYRLHRGDALKPSKAVPVELDHSLTPREAARRIVSSCLAHLLANEAGLSASDDPEFVHQMRVANRRLRSALRVFRGIIGKDVLDHVVSDLRWLGGVLGEARDWDVFLGETLPPLATAFGDEEVARHALGAAQEQCKRARAAMLASLASSRHAGVILGIARWSVLAEPVPPDPATPVTLREFAARVVRRRHMRVLDQAGRLVTLSDTERHRLRLDVKQLRYAVEFIAPLFPAGEVDDYLRNLGNVQSTLGAANDATNALHMIATLATPEAFGVFARGWFLGRADDHIERSRAVFDRLRRVPRFWKDQSDTAGDSATVSG